MDKQLEEAIFVVQIFIFMYVWYVVDYSIVHENPRHFYGL